MRTPFFYIIVLLCTVSCVRNEPYRVLTVNLNSSLNNELSFYDLFDKLDIIPLEDSCLISNGQYSEPQYLSIWDNGYFVLDERSGSLYSFGLDGSYKGTISRRGHANNEYDLAYGVQWNDKNNYISVLDPRANIYRYKNNGVFISAEHINGITAIHSFYEKNDTCVFFTSSDRENLHLWCHKKIRPIVYTPSISLKNQFNAPFPFIKKGNELYYYEGVSGDIYALNLSSCIMEKVFSWNFLMHNVDVARLQDPDYDFLTSLRHELYDCVYPFLNIAWLEDLLIANVLYHNAEHLLIYNLSTDQSYLIKEVKEGARIKFMVAKDDTLYLLTDSESLSEFVSLNILDDNNKEVYRSVHNTSSNPVLLKYSGIRFP